MADPAERQRLDRWIWHARVVRTREAAADLVRAGHVRIDGARVTSPAHAVKPGQVLTIALDQRVRVLRVVGFSERRGGATSASVLYNEITES
ncbi:RNA-binding S4 domain-containing protein [Xanthobacter autotrophicus DSM 431]|uniref:RNA-binding S4 domain-containing protein n=1 Tax=Xanthobacter nonsaccharivorans TaxID=3119912 RepID=UPI00372BB3C4